MANDTPKTFWTVAVTDGWIVDDKGRYVRDQIRFSCGHLHRTEEAADDCHAHLTRWYCGCGKMSTAQARATGHHCQGGSPTTSAKWYNSVVLPVDADGRHIPQQTRSAFERSCDSATVAEFEKEGK